MAERRAQTDGPPLPFGTQEPERAAPWRGPSHPPMGLLPAVQSLLYVLVFALFLMAFTVQPIRIPSSSMEPTLLVGDFLLLDKEAVAGDAGGLLPPGGVKRGDVVVFHDPVEDSSIHLVKRVVGMPGDRLHLKDGVVYVNGMALPGELRGASRTLAGPVSRRLSDAGEPGRRGEPGVVGSAARPGA